MSTSRPVRTVTVTATAEQVSIERTMSSCPCVTVESAGALPKTLVAGQSLTLTVTVDPEHYVGAFRRLALLQIRSADGVTAIVQLPVEGTVREAAEDGPKAADAPPWESSAPTTRQPPAVALTEYDGRTAWSELSRGLVLFVSPECGKCRWLLVVWLPRFRQSQPEASVVTVDVTEEAGLKLLLAVEKDAAPDATTTPGNETPVIWYNGHLVYGQEAANQLLSTPASNAQPITTAKGK